MDSTLPGCLPETRVIARQSRKVFFIAVGMVAVLALAVAFPGTHAAGRLAGLKSCFTPFLLWCLVVAAYAFHSLAQANARLMDQLGNKLVWERMKGLRQLAAIKARLRGHSAPGPE